MAEELKVYLDHHISRDDFLYKRSSDNMPLNASKDLPNLRIRDLYGENSMDRALRKPDFQRVTWSWSPIECVSLLESVVKEQVIPSIIMWLSPEKRWYVLDGGHRISVVLAWLRDDWGDKLPTEVYNGDKELEEKIMEAAREVHSLLKKYKIGKFEDYRKAYEKFENLPSESQEFETQLQSDITKFAEFYRSIVTGTIGFPLQWVKGDYKKAEESFLKINSGGRSLTEWEIKLVQNRNSSFARLVMSLANITRVEHCWPTKVPDEINKSQVKRNVTEILDGIAKLHRILYEPPQDSSFRRLQQPVFAEPRTEPDKKPVYLAELLTVIEGGKGQEPQTEKLIKQDQSAPPDELVSNGLKRIKDSLDVFSHLVGDSSQLQSLALVPALYFYTENGKHVRSLLYGFIYWLFDGNDPQITLTRKLLFSVYRGAFEQILMLKKKEIVNSFSRKIGSGSEVTEQTAKYYDGLLSLLIKHNGNIKSEAFVEDYDESFGQKSTVTSSPDFGKLSRCYICRGLLDLTIGRQTEHETETSKGIENTAGDELLIHPFCNSHRHMIESIESSQKVIELPPFQNPQLPVKIRQLTFLEFETLAPNERPFSTSG